MPVEWRQQCQIERLCPPQQGIALPQHAPVLLLQMGIDRLELNQQAIEPVTALLGPPSYQVQVKGGKLNAAERAQQIKLSP